MINAAEEIKYVSGTIYSYSFLCMRKVWLSYHNLSMEQESELVEIGKFIDETTYKNERHNFMIDKMRTLYENLTSADKLKMKWNAEWEKEFLSMLKRAKSFQI